MIEESFADLMLERAVIDLRIAQLEIEASSLFEGGDPDTTRGRLALIEARAALKRLLIQNRKPVLHTR